MAVVTGLRFGLHKMLQSLMTDSSREKTFCNLQHCIFLESRGHLRYLFQLKRCEVLHCYMPLIV